MKISKICLLAVCGLLIGGTVRAADHDVRDRLVQAMAAVNAANQAAEATKQEATKLQGDIATYRGEVASVKSEIRAGAEQQARAAAASAITQEKQRFAQDLQAQTDTLKQTIATEAKNSRDKMAEEHEKFKSDYSRALKEDEDSNQRKLAAETQEGVRRRELERQDEIKKAQAEEQAAKIRAGIEAVKKAAALKAKLGVELQAKYDRLKDEKDKQLYKDVFALEAGLEEEALAQEAVQEARAQRVMREKADNIRADIELFDPSNSDMQKLLTEQASREAMQELRGKIARLQIKDSDEYKRNQQMLMAEEVKQAVKEANQKRELIREKARVTQEVKNQLELELLDIRQQEQLARDRQQQESQERMFAHRWKNIRQMFSSMGQGMKDPKRLAYMALAVGGTAGLIYAMRLMFKQLEIYLNRPRLVRDTSKRGLFSKKKVMGPTFKDMVLSKTLEAQLKRVMQSATQAYVYGTNLPNVGLFGPPGTGKTMFIEALANESGMTYAKMTGGDVSALLSSGGKNQAVTEIHKLFDWLEAHGPAVLLVDEADAFLKNGRDGKLSEGLTSAINAFLSRTGSSSNKVMVVFATNYPQALDGAVQNRVSTWIHVGRPELPERVMLLKKSLQKLRQTGLGKKHVPVRIDGTINDAFIDDLARHMSGFAGRDIKMKFMDTLERELARRGKFTVTSEVANEVLKHTLDQERDLTRWTQGDRPDFNGIAEAMSAAAA